MVCYECLYDFNVYVMCFEVHLNILLGAYAFNCLFIFNVHYLCFLFLCVANCHGDCVVLSILLPSLYNGCKY